MNDNGEKTCPLCAEEMDLTDQHLKPCKCGYQVGYITTTCSCLFLVIVRARMFWVLVSSLKPNWNLICFFDCINFVLQLLCLAVSMQFAMTTAFSFSAYCLSFC